MFDRDKGEHLHLHIHLEQSDFVVDFTNKLLQLLKQIQQTEVQVGAQTDQAIAQLKAEVANNTSVDQSVLTLVQNLVNQLNTIGGSTSDQTTAQQINDLVTSLTANDKQIADAVVANTPAAPPTAAPTPAA